MMRSPGMVQALALKSISSHLALIASEVRGAVRIVICKVGGPRVAMQWPLKGAPNQDIYPALD
jgi:hypothetical protein